MPCPQGVYLEIHPVAPWASSSRLSGGNLYHLVALGVVGGGGTTAPDTRFPGRT